MFRHLIKNPSLWLIWAFSLLFSSCIEVQPPPPAPAIPTAQTNPVLHIGIDSNLATFESILTEHINVQDPRPQILFVRNTKDELQEQVRTEQLDGMFVYQKPAALDFWTMPVALDSIAIIAHSDLTLDSLSRAELQQIFTRDQQNWQPFSGQNLPISLFVMGGKSEIQKQFNERVMENRPFDVSAVVPLNLNDMLQAVENTEGAIGFMPTSAIDTEMAVQIVPVDSLFPQFNTVRSQQYPLTIPIYLVALSEPKGELRQLAAWLQSAEGQLSLSAQFVQIGN
ncbi:MAG: substrate-binding domain-containing protein [Anaerolineae bacterium]